MIQNLQATGKSPQHCKTKSHLSQGASCAGWRQCLAWSHQAKTPLAVCPHQFECCLGEIQSPTLTSIIPRLIRSCEHMAGIQPKDVCAIGYRHERNTRDFQCLLVRGLIIISVPCPRLAQRLQRASPWQPQRCLHHPAKRAPPSCGVL